MIDVGLIKDVSAKINFVQVLVGFPSRLTWLFAVFWGFLWVDGVLSQKETWRTVLGMREVRWGTALGRMVF